jgi:dihydroorotase/N-acyl-D-amino-acid deacylase
MVPMRALLVSLLVSVLSGQDATVDVLLRRSRVVDGAGTPWYFADIAIRGDSIVAVGHLPHLSARTTLDLAGLTVSPGFVDTHSHARTGIFAHPDAENYIRQGVTTLIEGPDGSSPIPLRPFLTKLAATPIAVNFGALAGHGSIRGQVMATANRAATPAELEQMKELTRQAMRDGAFGLSTGLFYVPGNYAPAEEVIQLARIAGELGGIHTSHIRDEAAQVLDSVLETIRIGEEGALPTQITHHKIIGQPNWGLSLKTLELVAAARRRGVDVTIDQYPYTASSTSLTALLPQWSQAGGNAALAERLAAPETRARIKAVVVDKIKTDRGGGDPQNIQLASCSFDASLAGKTLAGLARERNLAPTPEVAADIALDLITRGECSVVYHAIAEPDVERILQSPFTMVASDGGIPTFNQGVPHPRSYGTFARVLARYVRERGVLSLEQAVYKMSGFPATRFRLMDRGLIRPGMKADLAVFDPSRVQDKAEFGRPHQYAEGFLHVLVNGQFVLRDGKMTGRRPGRVLYGPAWRQ